MPGGDVIEFAVLVDGKKLPEYRIKDRAYTEVDLHGPSSYFIEEEGQKYPVVPFKVCLQRLSKYPLWISVHLDGQVVATRPMCGWQFQCDGIKVGDEIHELLFSLPRIAEPDCKEKPSELAEFAGTIRVVCTMAIEMGEKYLPVYQTQSNGGRGAQSQCTRLQHLSKKDVSQKQAHTGVIVSREGRTVKHLTRTAQFRRAMKYAPSSTVIEEVVLHYRPRIYATEPSPAPPQLAPNITSTPVKPLVSGEIKNSPRTPLNDVGNHLRSDSEKRALKTEQHSPQQPGNLLSAADIKRRESMIPEPPEDYADEETPMIRPKDIKKRASEMFDKIRIKQEHEDDEVSYIVVDDLDYYMFEDDSVIYMGEEDCQILDLSNNVSMIDLDDTISLDAEDDCYLE